MLIYVDLSYNQIYIVMRKLIFTLFATLVGFAAYAADLTGDTPKPIKLIRGDNIIGRERSSFSSVLWKAQELGLFITSDEVILVTNASNGLVSFI